MFYRIDGIIKILWLCLVPGLSGSPVATGNASGSILLNFDSEEHTGAGSVGQQPRLHPLPKQQQQQHGGLALFGPASHTLGFERLPEGFFYPFFPNVPYFAPTVTEQMNTKVVNKPKTGVATVDPRGLNNMLSVIHREKKSNI